MKKPKRGQRPPHRPQRLKKKDRKMGESQQKTWYRKIIAEMPAFDGPPSQTSKFFILMRNKETGEESILKNPDNNNAIYGGAFGDIVQDLAAWEHDNPTRLDQYAFEIVETRDHPWRIVSEPRPITFDAHNGGGDPLSATEGGANPLRVIFLDPDNLPPAPVSVPHDSPIRELWEYALRRSGAWSGGAMMETLILATPTIATGLRILTLPPEIVVKNFVEADDLEVLLPYRKVPLLIIMGKPEPSTEEINCYVGALTGLAVTPHQPQTKMVEAVRWQLCEGRLMRAINFIQADRTPETPVHTAILADVALPLHIHKQQLWEDCIRGLREGGE